MRTWQIAISDSCVMNICFIMKILKKDKLNDVPTRYFVIYGNYVLGYYIVNLVWKDEYL